MLPKRNIRVSLEENVHENQSKVNDTIWHVVDVFVKQYPKIQKDKKFIMVSKNNIYTTIDAKIENGDEITLSPPVVSGG